MFAPEFALSCLNRLQLRDNRQMVDLADPSGALQLVGTLKSRHRAEVDAHRRVHRPWGFYETVALGGRFQVNAMGTATNCGIATADQFIIASNSGTMTSGPSAPRHTGNGSSGVSTPILRHMATRY